MNNTAFIFKRAKELNYEFGPNRPTIIRQIGTYDLDVLANHPHDNETQIQEDVSGEIGKSNFNNAIIKFDIQLHDAHRVAIKKKKQTGCHAPKIAMENANLQF